MKKIVTFLVLIMLMCSCVACNKKDIYDVDTDTIYVSTDAKVIEVRFDTLEGYSDYDDYSSHLDGRMSDYNFKVGGILVWKDELEQVGVNRMRLKAGYSNCYSYSGYNNIDFMCTKLSEAKEFHYDYVANYINKADGSEVTSKIALADENNYIVYIKKDVNIYIDGTILYYSDNVEVLDENLIKATAEDFCCIIFK
ncbi:MAG: hypothetical protein IKL73_00830 [Lachnospiraceae bacterium]|nr:hypothetical protein [Lachnospiraceae bacterium]